MRTTVRTLLAVATLAAASLASAQTTITLSPGTRQSANSGYEKRVDMSPAFATQFTENSAFDGSVYITFSAQLTNNASGWYNIKLLQNSYKNSGIVLGLGAVANSWNGTVPTSWYAGTGRESIGGTSSNFSNSSLIGTAATPLSTKSFFTILIDYNTGTKADSVSIWRSNDAFSTLPSGTPDWSYTTSSSDFSFDRISVYSAANTNNFVVSDFTLTAVPEPSTYAMLLGAATLGFVGYRRFRKRQA